MKNFTNVKVKTFLLIFICISLIVQPICIYFYITNKIDFMDIIKHEFISIIFIASFAIIINEQIFKIIFYHMLKGKLIHNSYNKYSFAISCVILFFLFIFWSLFFFMKDFVYPYTLSVILLPLITDMRQNYIISNGFLINGFTVIPIESIQWFKTMKDKHTLIMTIKYNGNKKYKIGKDQSSIKQLILYFNTHNVPCKN